MKNISILLLVLFSCVLLHGAAQPVIGTTELIKANGGNASNLVVRTAIAGGSAFTVDTNTLVVTNGNVGIGTDSPSNTLQVIGSTAYPVRITGASGGGLILGAYNLNIGGFWNATATPSTANYSLLASATDTYINAPAASGDIYFLQANTAIPMFIQGTSGNVGIGTVTPGYKLHVAGDSYVPSNAAPFIVRSNALTLVTNIHARGTLFLQLAFDDAVLTTPSCTIIATNLVSTNYFGVLSPVLLGTAASVTNHYTYPAQTNAVFIITDTSGAGAAVRVLQTQMFN